MDKRFEKVIEKLENQSKNAVDTNKKLENVFKDVKTAQEDTDQKLTQIQKDFDKVIVTFNKETKKHINKFSKDVDQIKDKGASAHNELTRLSDEIKKSYELSVEKLINSIESKSKEILKIYDELEEIRAIKKGAEIDLEKVAKNQIKAINDFKKKSKNIMENTDISKLGEALKSYEKRIAKLEKHAHTHTFGGTKI